MNLICESDEMKNFSKGISYEVVREDKIHLTLIDNNGRKHTLIRRFVNRNFIAHREISEIKK